MRPAARRLLDVNYPAGSRGSHPQRVAAVIAAHNVGRAVAATVRACRAIPSVDLLIVVDDGSTDDTGRAARAAGAVVVRHSVERGRASAIETGVKVAAMRTVLSTTGSGSHQRRVRSLSSSTVGYASEESLALRPIGMGTPTPTARTVDVSIP